MSTSDFIMQIQSNVLGIPVGKCYICTWFLFFLSVRGLDPETTSKGAAILAGLATGLYNETIFTTGAESSVPSKEFTPQMTTEAREHLLKGWRRAFASLDDGE